MPLPDDIQLATITLGVPTSFLGRTVTTSLRVTPSHNLTWAATGEALPAFTEAVTIEEDGSASCQLPYVDQSGFINSKGQAFTMWAYTFSGTWSTDDGQVLKFQKSIQPLTGQSLIDLGVVPDGSISFPVAAAIPTVLSVAGNTGAVSGAQILADTTVAAAFTAKLNASQKGAASGVAALGSDSKLLEENIPERLTDDQLSATYAPVSGSANYAAKADVVPKWKANTAYLAGDKVISPAGDVVVAILSFTTGATFVEANWSHSTVYADATIFAKATDPNSLTALERASMVSSQASAVIKSVDLILTTGNSTNLTTFVSVTGGSFTFTAPASGKVSITVTGGYTMPTTTASLEMNLRLSNNTDVAGTGRRLRREIANAGGVQGNFVYKQKLTALVPGQSYTYILGIRNADGGGIVSIAGDNTTFGPVNVEVLAHPSDPVSPTAELIRFGAGKLPKWEAAKAAQAAGTRDAKILMCGDSTMFGYIWDSIGVRLVPKLQARGLGAVIGGTALGLSAGSNPRYTAGAGWPTALNYGFGSQGWQYSTPAGSLNYADPNVTADSFDVYYLKGNGTITLQVDNETPVAFDASGATSIGKISITAAAAASTAHTLKITAVGTGAIIFVEPWLSTAKKIRVGNAGAPSSNALTWNSGSGIYSRSAMAAYNPDLVIILHGANDAVSGYSAESVVSNLSGIAAAVPNADFVVMSSIPCQILSEAALQKQYAIRTRYATSFPFIDQNLHFVDWTTANAAGWMSDIRHGNGAGMEQGAIMIDDALAIV